MANKRKYKIYVGDFETTVYEGQEMTEVWASAIVALRTEDVQIFHSIEETWQWIIDQNENMIIYYHNLKFDGSYWIDYFLNVLHLEQAFVKINGRDDLGYFVKDHEMPTKTFKTSISDKGQWYTIRLRWGDKMIEFRDSYKLLPFSVKSLGKSFGTAHKKTSIEYEGIRWAGCEITDQEREYIANDVLVVKEAIEIMYKEGHDKLTIGACCLSEYKGQWPKSAFDHFFPNLYNVWINPKQHGVNNAGDWIRRSYRGGWTYLKKGCEKRIYKHGLTADVNSLYPSQMHSDGGREYPVGAPTFWTGNYIPPEAQQPHTYFFIRVKTAFELKKGYLPFIQIKGNLLYKPNLMLETSRPFSALDNKYLDAVYVDGHLEKPYRPVITMTCTDYKLFLEHYDLINPTIIDGCYFKSMSGLFDDYINKYRKMKISAETPGRRTISKLYLNNLYGKFATSTDSSFKKAYLRDDHSVGFYTIHGDDKKPGYIPIGTAITSYARDFTIRAAQKNYSRFIYADTDSIHCTGSASDLIDIPQHDTAFNHWKIESLWDMAYFARAKTYVEHVTAEDLQPVEPYYNLKAGGMTNSCKDNLLMSITGDVYQDQKKLTGEEAEKHLAELTQEDIDFINQRRTWRDFDEGLLIPGKLVARRIRGGTLLTRTTYKMRRS